jgi:hypothetical protein
MKPEEVDDSRMPVPGRRTDRLRRTRAAPKQPPPGPGYNSMHQAEGQRRQQTEPGRQLRPWVAWLTGGQRVLRAVADIYRDTGPVAAIVTDCGDPATWRFWADAQAGKSNAIGRLRRARSPEGAGLRSSAGAWRRWLEPGTPEWHPTRDDLAAEVARMRWGALSLGMSASRTVLTIWPIPRATSSGTIAAGDRPAALAAVLPTDDHAGKPPTSPGDEVTSHSSMRVGPDRPSDTG